MAAMWRVRYEYSAGDGKTHDSFYFHAADARSMKPKDLRAAVQNAKTRAKARLKKKLGKKVTILECNCVG